MRHVVGWLGLGLLVSGPAPVQAQAQAVWTCTLIESHHFADGKDTPQKGGGDYRIEIRPPVIELTANGRHIIGYDIAENTEHRLLGERGFETGDGETTTVKLALDKLNGRIVQTGISNKSGAEELVEVINGRCRVSRE